MLIPYSAPSAPARTEMEIKKSQFIADLIPVSSEEEAMEKLQEIRKEFRDARHHCYAWRIGTTQIREKSSDDGEPSGTAGHPMLHVLSANNLTNVLSVVTRYFGGIKLGTGGLARAYSKSVADSIEAADIVTYTPHLCITLTLPYTAVGSFEHYIKDTDIIVRNRSFTDTVQIELLSLPEVWETHARTFTDMTGGKAVIRKTGEEYVPIRTES